MKTLHLKIITSFIFFNMLCFCKAQQIYPLNTNFNSISNYSYLKDLNNELSPYIGVYKGIFQGNEITLFVTKQEHKLIDYDNQKFYRDIISIKFQIKNSSGIVLQDTQNASSNENTIESLKTKSNNLILSYSGTNCGVGWGKIILKKINDTQLSWTYGSNSSIINDQNCPGTPNLTVYLPQTENMIFTKQ
ncbi:hypothetical protein ODZ84_12205 [Chryseobacterium fluminis]|uniref:DUF6705 family protein n=1 Tax=Chryseobacterium fluminis TaxID=2983606 RepID=UPI00224E5AE8|nr:DUF6705 family protein [Chryseobacterium sp. MMS21-Ot14]UZT96003.1 hypothetical protein ODZ84_12205 [Chryseobacterium sp. MMS21-Ot14]